MFLICIFLINLQEKYLINKEFIAKERLITYNQMEIDNKKNVKKFHITGAIFFLGLALFTFFWRDVYELLGKPVYTMRIIFSSLILFVVGIAYLMNPAYFYCAITDRKITIRYFKFLRYWGNTEGMIEVFKNEVKGYELFSYNYGLTQELQISVKEQGQLVIYPPISIKLLNKKQKMQLVQALEDFIK